jgi:hypothetical protein
MMDAVKQIAHKLKFIRANVLHVFDDRILLLPVALAQAEQYFGQELIVLP